jgi:hypothetical protein
MERLCPLIFAPSPLRARKVLQSQQSNPHAIGGWGVFAVLTIASLDVFEQKIG